MKGKLNLFWLLFKKNNPIKNLNFMKEIIALFFIISFLTFMYLYFEFLLFHRMTVQLKHSNFDYRISGFSYEQIEDIRSLSFVEEVFPVKILSGPIIKDNREILVNDLIAVDNFNGREISPFNDKLIIKSNEYILNNPELNPIIIDFNIAKNLKVNIGDVVYIPFGEAKIMDMKISELDYIPSVILGEQIPFTVAAITEFSSPITSAVILWQNRQKDIFSYLFDDDLSSFYSYMYVKTKDKANHCYFYYEYLPLQHLKEYSIPFETIDDMKEVINLNKNSLVFTREELLSYIEENIPYLYKIIMIISILGFISYLIILYREINKKIININKNLFIISALGLTKNYLILYLLLDTLFIHFPIIILSILFNRYIIYNFTFNTFIPWYFLKPFILTVFFILIIAVIFNSIFFNFKLKKIDIATLLTKE